MGMAYSYLVGDPVGSKNVALDDARLGGSGDVGDVVGEDGIAVVGAPIAGKESDKPLVRVENLSVPAFVISIGRKVICSSFKLRYVLSCSRHTENDVMFKSYEELPLWPESYTSFNGFDDCS